jgi:hypothetical protein
MMRCNRSNLAEIVFDIAIGVQIPYRSPEVVDGSSLGKNVLKKQKNMHVEIG